MGMVQELVHRAAAYLLILLVCSLLPGMCMRSSMINFNRPRNGQVVTRQFSMSVILPEQVDAEATHDTNINNASIIGVSLNGVILYRGSGYVYRLESIMNIAKPAKGNIVLTVFQADNSNNILSSSSITVLVHDSDSHFVRRVEQTLLWAEPYAYSPRSTNTGPRHHPTQSSYLFVGLGTGIVARLSTLRPHKATVLDVNAEACEILGGVETVHCISPSRPLDFTHSLYFDIAIVSYTDMISIWQSSPVGSTGVSVETLYQTIVHMTRGSVWVLVPHAETRDTTSHWNTQLRSLHRKLQLVKLSNDFFTNISLSEYNNIGTMEGLLKVPIEELLHLHGVDIFVQQCSDSSDKNATQTGDSLLSQADPRGTYTEKVSPLRASTIISSDFTLGKVHVHIQNACLLNDGRSVVVFTQQRGAGMSAWDNLISLYTQDENNGFQFTPIRIREVPLKVNPEDPASQLTATAQHLLEHTDWETGLSAIPFCPTTGHIVHQIEALMQLLDCNHYVHSMRVDKDSADDEGRAVRLVRLLFPSMVSSKLNDWLTTVISLILEYSAEKCPRKDDSILPNAKRVRSALHPAQRSPEVHLRNHLFNTTTADSSDHFSVIRFRPRPAHEPPSVFHEMLAVTLQGAKCFKDLLLLGRTNTHVKFFPSAAIGALFRDFVYERMQVKVRNYCDTFCSAARDYNSPDPPLVCPPVSMDCTMHIYREQCPCEPALSPAPHESQESAMCYRKLRVTISIRAESRRILNLPALTEAMLATGLVHKEWLRSHILVLESLPFAEQVRIYAETDILICVHGAAAINGIFMRPGSVVFEIFNGRFVEFVFAPPLREVGVQYVYTYVRDHTAQTAGCDDVPVKCIQGSVYAAASIDCVRIRTCSVRVDVTDFELVFMQAYYHVLSHKWHGDDEAAQQTTNNQIAPLTASTDLAGEDNKGTVYEVAREIQAVYLTHVKHKRFKEALDTALQLLPSIDSSELSPIYFLELGVIYYSLGDHLQAYEYCQRALQGVDQAVWGVDIIIQINACLGTAGTYLDDLSIAGEHVIRPFLSAWELSVKKTLSSPNGAVEDSEKGARWGLRSTMMAAPLDSLEFNLLRSFERFGRHAECVNWYLSALHLPGLLQGGAYIIAYAMMEWSPARRADLEQLEQQLRLSDAFSLPAEVTLWDELRRVQVEGKHSISGASQCLMRYITTSDASIHVKDVTASMVRLILQEPSREPVLPVLQPMDEANSCRLVLFTQFYIHPDPQKNSDLHEVLQRNLDNPFLSAVYLVNEQEFDFSRLSNSSKIVQFVSGRRLTFQDAFLLINQYESGSTVVLANSDIYFDETLHRLARCGSDVSKGAILGPNQAFALLKWTSDRADPARHLRIGLRTDSQDAWVFRAPMHSHVVQRADFYLGQPKCDNRMVALLQEAQYQVSNPAFAIHAIELSYPTDMVIYANNEAVEGNVSDLLLSDEMYF